MKNTLNHEIMEVFNEYNLDLPNIPTDRKYWLVRTAGGTLYDEYLNDEFIAIGWNKLDNKEYCESVNKEAAIKILKEHYSENKQHSLILNNINRFFNKMKVGDIVLLPSTSSREIAFCEITSDVYIHRSSEEYKNDKKCQYIKRRKIRVLKKVLKNNLNLKLFKMLQSRHTISNINDYSKEIDSTLHNFYVKGESIFYTIKINKQKNLKAESIRTLTDIPWIAKDFLVNCNYDLSNLTSTIYIQSPGKQEYVGKGKQGAKFMIGLAIVCTFLLGGEVEMKGAGIRLKTQGISEQFIKVENQKLEKQKELYRHKEAMQKLQKEGKAQAPDINKYKKTSNQ